MSQLSLATGDRDETTYGLVSFWTLIVSCFNRQYGKTIGLPRNMVGL